MATTTRTRAMASPSNRATRTHRVSLAQRATHWRASMQASLPEFAGTPRFRRELLGVVLILMALLSAYVIGRGGDEGRLVSWWGHSLERSLGSAAVMVPVLLGLAALRAFGGQPGRVLEARHYLGGFAFTIAVVGLLQLGARPVGTPEGGALGSSVANLAVRFLGQFGAGLALFATGVLAIFLLAGSDLQTFANDVRALCRAIWGAIAALIAAAAGVETRLRRFGAALRETRDPESSPAIAIDPAPATRQKPAKTLPAPTEPALEPPSPPVINVPARTPQPAPTDIAAHKTDSLPKRPAAPLPLPDVSRLA